ncbi:MAG: LysR family transcriptional regulator [Verrucomicrobia bacterium]|nr:LysR family transcriptional regulator [Verrucomicrobiota bacterium]
MEFFQLRYFESIARLGSLTAAAAECHVSQPSLSTQLRNLEDEFGTRLLERRSRGVVPTRAGERLLVTARRLLGEVETCRRDVRHRNYAGLPELRLGIQPFLASVMLPGLLSRFLGGHDSYQVIVRELSHYQVTESLLSHTVDLCLSSLVRPVSAPLASRVLFTLRYALFTQPDHPAARLRRPQLRDLLAHRLALYNDPAGIVERVTQLGDQAGTPARVIFCSDQALTVFEMASAGLGVAVLPTLFAERARRRKMVMTPLADRSLQVPVVAAWYQGATPKAGLDAFLQVCRTAPLPG